MSIKKVLIANRGEIACRLIHCYQAMGLKVVAVYSEADKNALHVKKADEAVCIGPGPAQESYLNIEKILDAAKKTGTEAIHPGYGFLSERASFAEAVQKAGLVWIGPSPKVIDLMGNKIAAKKAAEKAKVPTLPWALVSENLDKKLLEKEATRIGFPLLLKAAAGGGGRGMRLVEKASELYEKAEAASREALAAFGSGELFLEKYCDFGRHIEVQLLGDAKGQVITLGERECSMQRRHQKVVEEAPASNLSDKTRKLLWESAKNLAQSVNYSNAGTCEFLVDAKENIYFLEMNTRLQVEHPVTEWVWGVDLPRLQILIAEGKTFKDLKLELADLSPRGHAIEVRLYAEDPAKGFMPCPGTLTEFHIPPRNFIRVDQGYLPDDEVSVFYDAMLCKVIAWGADRETARKNLISCLKESAVSGVKNNLYYLIDIMGHQNFIDANVNTKFLEKEFGGWKQPVLSDVSSKKVVSAKTTEVSGSNNPWEFFAGANAGGFQKKSASSQYSTEDAVLLNADQLRAEYTGKVLKLNVKQGDTVQKDQVVVVCEAMKMEFSYTAPYDTVVKEVHIKTGQVVNAGELLLTFIKEK